MFNLNSIEYTTKTRYSMFKLINFYFFGKIIINLEFDGCNTFQSSWDRVIFTTVLHHLSF